MRGKSRLKTLAFKFSKFVITPTLLSFLICKARTQHSSHCWGKLNNVDHQKLRTVHGPYQIFEPFLKNIGRMTGWQSLFVTVKQTQGFTIKQNESTDPGQAMCLLCASIWDLSQWIWNLLMCMGCPNNAHNKPSFHCVDFIDLSKFFLVCYSLRPQDN